MSICEKLIVLNKICRKSHLNKKQKIVLCSAYIRLISVRFLHRYGYSPSFFKFGGKKIFIDRLNDFYWIFCEIFIDEGYYFETDSNNPNIVDCGSNIGLSVIYFKFIYPEASIIAFEPSEKIFDILHKNVESFGLKGVLLNKFALSNMEGETTVYGEGMGGTIFKEFNKSQVQVEGIGLESEVRVDVLSKHVNNLAEIDFLKLDIEGSEADVIGEIDEKRILERINNISMEYHSFSRNSNILSKIILALEKNNFAIHVSSDKNNFAELPKREYRKFMLLAKKI